MLSNSNHRDRRSHLRSARSLRGFSLLEILVSLAILGVMMAAAATMVSQTQNIWTSSWSRASQFRDARLAFELVTRNLSQSTLNTYWDYVKDSNSLPVDYQRQSELHFFTAPIQEVISGHPAGTHGVFFQAILGYSQEESFQQLDTLLNGRGYYIDFNEDDFLRPNFLSSTDRQPEPRWRYRLMEYVPPSENNLVYFANLDARRNGTSMEAWFSEDLLDRYSRPVVENVVAMIISPQKSPDAESSADDVYSIAPSYRYDSRDSSNTDTHNLLPPLVRVTLVVLSEPSASRLQEQYGEEAPADLLDPEWFRVARDYEEDLAELEEEFQKRDLQYRVFSTTVAIRSAKWSQ